MSIRAILGGATLSLIALLYATTAHAQLAGTMDYNNTAGRMSFFDGSQWYYFAAGVPSGTSCTSQGVLDYNTLLNTYQVCDGAIWNLVGGVLTLNVCSNAGTLDYTASTFEYCNGLVWVDVKGPVVTS